MVGSFSTDVSSCWRCGWIRRLVEKADVCTYSCLTCLLQYCYCIPRSLSDEPRRSLCCCCCCCCRCCAAVVYSRTVFAPRALSASQKGRLDSYAMHLRQPLSTDCPVRQRISGASDQSRDGLVEKLADARCKWMVTLHRYSSKIDRGNVYQNTAVRKTSVRGNDIPGRGLVPASDFCPECGSIVPVELERSSEGEFIAEHRWGCSVCEIGQSTCRGTTQKAGMKRSRRIVSTSRRRFLDEDWRRWKVQPRMLSS